jgi:hypothetical protein
MWFEQLTGFRENTPNLTRSQLELSGNSLISKANNAHMICGSLETPSLGDLRLRGQELDTPKGKIKISEVVGDIGEIHTHLRNAGALFQVASQFNLLEMSSQSVTPEEGIDRYERDHTQGPACAIACGAGTIYRNYLAPVNGQTGQSMNNQLDTLQDLGQDFGNQDNRLWEMSNGYALATESGLKEITRILQQQEEAERDKLRENLRIGIQWNTQVTRDNCKHLVSQVYASALPVSYSEHPPQLWAEFAKLVLEAAYEATLFVALINTVKTGNNKVYLTLLGGGAFGNRNEWILASMSRAICLFADKPLDVRVVSYGISKPFVTDWIKGFL